MKRLAYALAFTALTSMPALAQSATTEFVPQAQSGDYRASKIVGVNIYGADNQKIGDVNDVILGSNGQAKDIVIGVGGFLGIGEKNVAVPFSAVQWTAKPMQSGTMAMNNDAASATAPAGTGSVGTATGTAAMNQTGPNGADKMSGPAPSGAMAMKGAPAMNNTADGTATVPSTTNVAMTNAMANTPKDYPDHGMVNLTKDQLQNAPAFKYASEVQ